MTKPLKISEQAAVQMPMKTVASLIMMVAIGTWAYFGLHETLNQHSTKITTTSYPFFLHSIILSATILSESVSATLVPPNFCTINAIGNSLINLLKN